MESLAVSIFLVSLIFAYCFNKLLSLSRTQTDKLLEIQKRKSSIENYPIIIAIVDEAKKAAFESLYTNHIVVYMASDQKVTAKDLGQLSTEYLKSVIEFVGPDLLSDLEYVHGDLDSIYLSWTEEFKTKVVKKEYEISNLKMDLNKSGLMAPPLEQIKDLSKYIEQRR